MDAMREGAVGDELEPGDLLIPISKRDLRGVGEVNPAYWPNLADIGLDVCPSARRVFYLHDAFCYSIERR
jgi:hypothetical protein